MPSPETCFKIRAPAHQGLTSTHKRPARIDFPTPTSTFRAVKKAANLEPAIDKNQALKSTFELINAQLYSVEERIRQQARAFDPAVEGYVAYAIESHGKRLRPALALLAGGATGNICPSHFDLAVVVELIHAATLVHDDILDGADKRRGQPTANAKWGNAISVLLGDCLFAHALKLSLELSERRNWTPHRSRRERCLLWRNHPDTAPLRPHAQRSGLLQNHRDEDRRALRRSHGTRRPASMKPRRKSSAPSRFSDSGLAPLTKSTTTASTSPATRRKPARRSGATCAKES